MDIYEAVTKIVADNESARYGNFFRSDILTDDLFKQLATIFDKSAFTLLFLFQGLMNEHVGANIRNEIAHGLMSEAKGNDGAARFFFCWFLKLLALTARNFYEIDT